MKKYSLLQAFNLIFLQTKIIACLGLNSGLETAEGAWQKQDDTPVHNILVVKVDEIGDFVLASVFLRELRHLYPDAHITLIVNPVTYNLAELCPYADKIMIYRQHVPLLLRPFVLPWRAFQLGRHVLRMGNIDLALAPRWDTDGYYSAYISYFSGAKRRIGYSEQVNFSKSMLNKGFDLLLTDTLTDAEPRHEVERHLDFIRRLGGNPSSDALELWLDSQDNQFADRIVEKTPHAIRVALCPGAGAKYRQWPLQRFIELGRRLIHQYQAFLIIVGGRGDRKLGEQMKKALGKDVIDLSGKLTLRQTAAMIKRCSLYVGNDTGAMHLAAAAGVPVVELSCFPVSGPPEHWNSPFRFGPWRVPCKIMQPKKVFSDMESPLTRKHLNRIIEISVAEVQRAIIDLQRNVVLESVRSIEGFRDYGRIEQ